MGCFPDTGTPIAAIGVEHGNGFQHRDDCNTTWVPYRNGHQRHNSRSATTVTDFTTITYIRPPLIHNTPGERGSVHIAVTDCAHNQGTHSVTCMKVHEGVKALLDRAEAERRCAIGRGDTMRHALRRRLRTGELISPYVNLYARSEYWNRLTVEERSLHTIRALAIRRPGWVFAGLSAVCLYGLEHSYDLHDGAIHIASRNGPNKRDDKRLRRLYMSHTGLLWQASGILVTPPARTLIDCATYPFANALAIYDSALRRHLVGVEEVRSLALRANCDEEAVGRLLRHASPHSENGGESLMRGLLISQGFAEPQLQVEFDNPDNPSAAYRVDFCWRLADGRVIVVEYDGMAKYADASNPNRASLQQKLDYERRRERHLREQNVGMMVHIVYEDLMRPERLERKLLDAGVPKIR